MAKSKIWAISSFVVISFLFVLSCFHRFIHIDDAFLGEQAYWLAQVGKVRSELFRGLLNYEDQVFVYHKLYIWQGALITKLLGFNVYYLKSIALVYLVAFLCLFWKFLKLQNFSSTSRVWLLTLAIVNPFMFEMSFVFRPDVAVTFWGLLSCYYLFKSDKRSDILLAALSAGVAAATHLNGLVFISAGGILLLTRAKWKDTFLFGLVAGVIALFYFHDVRSAYDFKELVFQLTHDPVVEKESYGFWSLPIRLLDEQRRYFHSPREIAYSIMLLAAVVFSWKTLWSEKRELCVYTFAVACSLALLAHGKGSKYLIYLLPLHLTLVGWSIASKFSKLKVASAIAYAAVSLWVIYPLIVHADEYIAENKKWAQKIEPHSNVLAPLWFIFGEIGDLRVQGLLSYEFMLMHEQKIPDPNYLFSQADHFNNKYILIESGQRDTFKVQPIDYPPYKLVAADKKYLLFERVE